MKYFQMLKKTVILLFLLCFPLQVSSQTQWHGSVDSLIGELLNSMVVATRVAPIRTDPPNGYFRIPGRTVSNTALSAQYMVSDYTTVPYLFSTQTWVQLMTNDEDTPIGWVYWGEVADPSNSTNFSHWEEAMGPSNSTNFTPTNPTN